MMFGDVFAAMLGGMLVAIVVTCFIALWGENECQSENSPVRPVRKRSKSTRRFHRHHRPYHAVPRDVVGVGR